MEIEKIDDILIKENTDHKDEYFSHYLEQYKIYLHIFNSTSDRRQKSNEFFLGLNAAIIAILGYVETKILPHASLVLILAPFIGIGICYSWYRIILAYRQLNRAKFRVIHETEAKLPLSLFKTEWHVLGRGKDKSKYYPLSQIEKNIPLMFIGLYIIILLISFPWQDISALIMN